MRASATEPRAPAGEPPPGRLRRDDRIAAIGPLCRLAGLCWVVAVMAGGCAVYDPAPPHGQDKIAVCHKGKKTLWVAEPAVKAHLGHGDSRGPCR